MGDYANANRAAAFALAAAMSLIFLFTSFLKALMTRAVSPSTGDHDWLHNPVLRFQNLASPFLTMPQSASVIGISSRVAPLYVLIGFLMSENVVIIFLCVC